uniref:Toxin candidate TRINITY_DN37568_c0_g2_i2.p1 n=1 Tax=Pachycerianthus maua TaxID=2736681 RepID=A0A7G7WYX7_9CNID|nr:toxin candidate TRINITY_DN37568_c0_g2_i2.p1 [Pachycerianthus maua]
MKLANLVCLFVFVSAFVHSGSSSCQNGWYLYGNSCYYISTDTFRNWNGALLNCILKNSRLVCIQSSGEYQFITNRLREIESTHGQPSDVNFRAWLGTTYLPDRQSLYCNGLPQSSLNYFNWAHGHPRFSSKSCVLLNYNYQYVDTTCSITTRFICERPAN